MCLTILSNTRSFGSGSEEWHLAQSSMGNWTCDALEGRIRKIFVLANLLNVEIVHLSSWDGRG